MVFDHSWSLNAFRLLEGILIPLIKFLKSLVTSDTSSSWKSLKLVFSCPSSVTYNVHLCDFTRKLLSLLSWISVSDYSPRLPNLKKFLHAKQYCSQKQKSLLPWFSLLYLKKKLALAIEILVDILQPSQSKTRMMLPIKSPDDLSIVFRKRVSLILYI